MTRVSIGWHSWLLPPLIFSPENQGGRRGDTFSFHYFVERRRNHRRKWDHSCLALFLILSTPPGSSSAPWSCESGHCGKDGSGKYAPATFTVTGIQDDIGREVELLVCDLCVSAYRNKRRTKTLWILSVERLWVYCIRLEPCWCHYYSKWSLTCVRGIEASFCPFISSWFSFPHVSWDLGSRWSFLDTI